MWHLITMCVQSLVKEVFLVSSTVVMAFVGADHIFAFGGIQRRKKEIYT